MESPRKIKRIVVLGGGTAGMISAVAIKRNLPDIELTVVRSTKMGVIGVGEGTIPSVPHFLHRFAGIDKLEFHREVRPTIKLGIRYLWGPRPYFHYTFSPQLMAPNKNFEHQKGFYCDEEFDFADTNSALMEHDKVCFRRPNGMPRYNPNHAYHLENRKFVGFMEKVTDRMGINKVDAIVEHVIQDENGIRGLFLDNGQTCEADFFVDCSGFKGLLIGETLNEEWVEFNNALYCDSAVVGGWERTPDDVLHPFTTAETMKHGWAWKIEHDEIINRGYVFCSKFVSDDEAEAEFREKNPKLGETRVIRFNAGVRRRSWVKNVFALGNSAGFVEPLEATSIGMICDAALHMVKALKGSGGMLLDPQRTVANRVAFKNWEIIRDFLALHYRFNHRYDTPFWKACLNDVPLGDAQEIVDYYREVGPDLSLFTTELKRDFFTAEGYLAMLVGQKVPYRNNIEIPSEQRNRWTEFKTALGNAASNGVDMQKYLELERTVGVEISNNAMDRKLHKRQQVNPVGQGYQTGELNWH
ncbi:MAG: tryptophan halogenase family protein [Planctomycetota bacterium]